MKRAIAAAALLLASLGSAQSDAPPRGSAPAAGYWLEHNGSLMAYRVDDRDRLEIRYHDPRPILRYLGVNRGTTLFYGQQRGPTVFGVAHVFASSRCLPIAYSVIGAVNEYNALVLHGPAPVVDPRNCAVIGLAPNSVNAELVFRPVRKKELD